VDLQEIDVWCVEAGEGCIDSSEDGLAREAALVHVVDCLVDVLQGHHFGAVAFSDGTAAFSADDEFVAGDVVFFDSGADDGFGGAVRVDVGCVPGVEAAVVGGFQEREGFGFFDYPAGWFGVSEVLS